MKINNASHLVDFDGHQASLLDPSGLDLDFFKWKDALAFRSLKLDLFFHLAEMD